MHIHVYACIYMYIHGRLVETRSTRGCRGMFRSNLAARNMQKCTSNK